MEDNKIPKPDEKKWMKRSVMGFYKQIPEMYIKRIDWFFDIETDKKLFEIVVVALNEKDFSPVYGYRKNVVETHPRKKLNREPCLFCKANRYHSEKVHEKILETRDHYRLEAINKTR